MVGFVQGAHFSFAAQVLRPRRLAFGSPFTMQVEMQAPGPFGSSGRAYCVVHTGRWELGSATFDVGAQSSPVTQVSLAGN